MGIITIDEPNPEACYRYLSALSHRADLIEAVPARASLLNDPQFTANQSPEELLFYRSYGASLGDPNLVTLPSPFGTSGTDPYSASILQQWMHRAFDRYVMEDADLLIEMQDAEAFAAAFLDCTTDIPPFDPVYRSSQEEGLAYYRLYADCAMRVDPEMADFFSFFDDIE